MDPAALAALETGYLHLLANKYYFLASTAMLLYDHMLTFESEITLIWRRKFALPTYLFFIFRYTTPLVCILDLFAQHDPTWTGTRCSHWIWLPVAMAPIVSAATGVILILRTHAVYNRAAWILYIMVPVYLGQLGVMGWALPAGVAAQLPPGFVGCIPSEKPGSGNRLSYINVAMLVFDASVFILTLGRAVYLRIGNSRLPLIRLITRDGILYFFVLFAVNVVNVILLSVAPPDLSAINSPFATIIATTLVSRLMLNLREASATRVHVSDGTYIGQASTRPDVGKWNPRPTFAESMLGINDFDAPLGERQDDARIDGPECPTMGTGSWTTSVAKNDAGAHESDSLEVELRLLEQGNPKRPV